MRGGTAADALPRAFEEGLSPRARGNLDDCLSIDCLHGPIPACAGEPIRLVWIGNGSRAYPRVRGGTGQGQQQGGDDVGLSPRARGNQIRTDLYKVTWGPIPACAGEPPVATCSPCTVRAYPRVRGGTMKSHRAASGHRGLSPRARGNPGSRPKNQGAVGPIPACAGEPGVCLLASR